MGDDREEKSGALYKAYQEYCRMTGGNNVSGAVFSAGLERLGYEKKKTRTGAIVYGLELGAAYQNL